MIDLDITLDDSIDRVVGALDATDKSVRLAVKRATRKMVRWIEREASQVVTTESGIKQKALKQGGRVRIRAKGESSLLWIGLDPVSAHHARTRWSRRSAGATVNGRLLPGTFRAAVYGDQPKIWIRTSRNQQMGHVLANRRRKSRAVPSDLNRGRFPVELVGVELTKPDKLDRRLEPRAKARFEKLLEQELNYALKVETKR